MTLSALLFSFGCTSITPPDNYYQQVVEMEKSGERARQKTGRRPGETVEPVKQPEPAKTESHPVKQLSPIGTDNQEETPIILENEHGKKQEVVKPPEREVIEKKPQPKVKPIPIAVSSDVIRIALRDVSLGVNARNVELVNGRLTGGKNSVRVNFFCKSVDQIYSKFVAICAVTYHLDRNTKSIDTIVGIAEDSQANMLAIIQTRMDDVVAWMTNKKTRAEWLSKVNVKLLQ